MVFIGHGITVAFFVFVAAASVALINQSVGTKTKQLKLVIIIYLLIVLLLCKSATSIVLATLFFGVIYTFSLALVKAITRIVCIFFLCYPLVAIFVPDYLYALGELIEKIDPERGQSFIFRLDHERQLLSHIGEKIVFGWGTWGRMRFDQSITDSSWLIMLGQFGLFGFFTFYGALISILFRCLKFASLSSSFHQSQKHVWMCFLLCLVLLDQLVNSSLTSSGLYLMLFGMVLAQTNFIVFQAHRRVFPHKQVTGKYRTMVTENRRANV